MTVSPIILAICVILCAGYASGVCRIRPVSLSIPQPLMVNNSSPYSDVRRFVDVDSSGYTYMNAGETITFLCSGTYNYLIGGNFPMTEYAIVYCDGTNFIVDGRTVTPSSVTCYSDPQVQVEINSDDHWKYCGDNETFIEVGFDLFGSFAKVYDVCFNSDLQTPVSTRHLVVPGSRGSYREKMSAYLFGPVDPETAYVKAAQIASFTEQLDSASASKYITTSNLLVYQFLVPFLDFIHISPQCSTYFYLNTVPVWKLFQNGYWLSLEKDIRTLAYTEGDLEINTSVHGIAQLRDSMDTPKNIFLHSANKEKAIPVPAYLVKTVRNSQNETVIFLQAQVKGEKSRILKAEGLCAEDVCAQLRWLPWGQVPPAQRSVACCAANDAFVQRNIPLSRGLLSGEFSTANAGLLVGKNRR